VGFAEPARNHRAHFFSINFLKKMVPNSTQVQQAQQTDAAHRHGDTETSQHSHCHHRSALLRKQTLKWDLTLRHGDVGVGENEAAKNPQKNFNWKKFEVIVYSIVGVAVPLPPEEARHLVAARARVEGGDVAQDLTPMEGRWSID